MSTGTVKVQASVFALPDGGSRLAVELSADAPPPTAIAVVFDLSDSCRIMTDEARRLSRWLATMPASWPLWLYRLSDANALDSPGSLNIGRISDTAVDIGEWITDRGSPRLWRDRGSFIRPVMESLKSRAIAEQVDTVYVMVLSDGELLDLSPVAVSSKLRVIGIAQEIVREKELQWRRVLPKQPLLTIDSDELPMLVDTKSRAFYGVCRLRFTRTSGKVLKAVAIDLAQARTNHAAQDELRRNLAASPGLFVCELPSEFKDLSILVNCRSVVTNDEIVLTAAIRDGAVSTGAITTAIDAFKKRSDSVIHTVSQFSSRLPEFDRVWAALEIAATLSKARKVWTDKSGRLVQGLEALGLGESVCRADRISVWDALLVAYACAPGRQVEDAQSAFVIGLLRSDSPSLMWPARTEIPNAAGYPISTFSIGYDSLEGRWVLTAGDRPARELEPRGSEVIGEPLLSDETCPWSILFSGDLR